MRPRRWVFALIALIALAGVAVADRTPWARARRPSRGEPRAIGGTSSGCLAGGEVVPRRGDGFEVMRPGRRRNVGHPILAAVIRDLGRALAAESAAPLRLGDLSQPRGGPAPDGHASHQTGLDVDVWFAARGRGRRARPIAMVDRAAGAPTAAWGTAAIRPLELAARDPRVDRIFVNPVLKRALCDATEGDRTWLARLRPWWGHDEHFHLRLACPADSPDCVPQAPVPAGDGCAELDDWLSEAAAAKRAAERKAYRARIGSKPALPAACAALITRSP